MEGKDNDKRDLLKKFTDNLEYDRKNVYHKFEMDFVGPNCAACDSQNISLKNLNLSD